MFRCLKALKEQSTVLCSFPCGFRFRLRVGAELLLAEGLQGGVDGWVEIEHRVQIREVEQVAYDRIRTRAFQVHVSSLGPGLQQGELTDSGAIHRSHAAQIEDEVPGVLQNLAHEPRQGGGFVAIDDAALAVDDDDIAAATSFQTELQLRLLFHFECSQRIQRLRGLPIRVQWLHANE